MASALVSFNKSIQHRKGLSVPAKTKIIQIRMDMAVPEFGNSEIQLWFYQNNLLKVT